MEAPQLSNDPLRTRTSCWRGNIITPFLGGHRLVYTTVSAHPCKTPLLPPNPRRHRRHRHRHRRCSDNPTTPMAAAADSDDLDQLLDSALDDFTKIDLASAKRDGAGLGPAAPGPSAAPVQGLGMGLPDLKAKKKGKQQRDAPKKGSHASEALDQLMRETQEAVRGLESAAGSTGAASEGVGMESEAMVEDFVKQFEELAGTQDMESIVQTMMQQLLSKEILHEPMREIGERYPKWLEEHKDGLAIEEYDRYQRQYKLILKLNEVYETEPDNFQKIVDLMQKMQECGQPPSDIVQELAPGLDLSNLGSQLSPELLDSSSNCCVM